MTGMRSSEDMWRQRTWLLVALTAAVALAMALIKPIPQPLAYHAFHDARGFLGIPNFLNVVSNLPFLIIGMMGLAWLRSTAATALDPELRAPYALVFAALALTAAGSAYYHWAPDNHTLIWDRLPIAVSFMALFAAILAERVTLKAGRLLVPLALLGAASVGYWHLTDDLRPYLLAQFLPVLMIPIILWLYPARYSHGRDFLISIGFYAAAKLAEFLDGQIYGVLGSVSGHTLKHLIAAGGTYWIYRMLVQRQHLT